MLIIQKEKIGEWLKELTKKFIVIDARKDILPFKQYFLPPEEEIFVFDKNKKKLLAAKKTEEFILFGLHPKAAGALAQLAEIMKTPKPDFFYFQKRQAATVVSVTETEETMPHKEIDLILEKIPSTSSGQEKYKAHVLSKKGEKIAKNKFFKKTNLPLLHPAILRDCGGQAAPPIPELRKLLLDPELLKDAVEWSWQGCPEIWEKLGQQCLGCGICTYVCPLCHCFSIGDKCSIDKTRATKIRRWTACTLPEFSQITGGHKFHGSIKERYYNWFFHKFVRAYKEYGKAQCVACGNCKKNCPAGIDIEQVILDILKNFQKNKKQGA